jgi:hypothetical protein
VRTIQTLGGVAALIAVAV